MQARTAFRLAMLANGYWPLLNDCKRSIETGWPTAASSTKPKCCRGTAAR